MAGRPVHPDRLRAAARPTGKLLTADNVVVVAQAAGLTRFAEPKFSQEFACAVSAALGKPVMHVDVAAFSISY